MKSTQMRTAAGLVLVLATTTPVIAQPSTITLSGKVIDFRASAEVGGHSDFETLQQFQEGAGPKIYCVNLVAPNLGADGFPQLNCRWITQTSGVTEQLNDVDFVFPNIGYAVGAVGKLLKTTDSGATWTIIPTGSGADLRAVDFVSQTRGFIACQDGKVLETSDGGLTWRNPAPLVSPLGELWDIQFPVDDTSGYAIASSDPAPGSSRIFHRGPAPAPGAWSSRAVVAGRVLRAMHFPVNDQAGVAVGLAGAILKTTNGFAGPIPTAPQNVFIVGANNPSGGKDLNAVHFVDNLVGFTVGNGGLIMKTVNGGTSWTVCNAGVTANLYGVRVVRTTLLAAPGGPGGNANFVYVVGAGGVTLISKDAGVTWSSGGSLATADLRAVTFPMPTVGFAVGNAGAVERYGAGQLITAQWTDILGRFISPTLFNPSLGDLPGTYGKPYFERINTEPGFAQWWHDTPGVNMSDNIDLDFERQVDGTYLFDSTTQEPFASRGGFFPIDSDLLGDYSTTGHNFHFTFHMKATFTYDASATQVLAFEGDDDVWVFFNGKLAIDVGGRHPPRGQVADLNRLGLIDGQPYTMDFFSAERQTVGSNIKIQTNIEFTPVAPGTISAGFD